MIEKLQNREMYNVSGGWIEERLVCINLDENDAPDPNDSEAWEEWLGLSREYDTLYQVYNDYTRKLVFETYSKKEAINFDIHENGM